MHEVSKAQATFKKVIDGGYYSIHREHCHYMCRALYHALIDGAITNDEHMQAYDSLHQYMKDLGSDGSVLLNALLNSGLVDDPYRGVKMWVASGEGAEFYLNWDKRPYP